MDVPATPIKPPSPAGFFRRKDFPEDFIFGAATSAFQIEGGLQEENRGPSNWDDFAVQHNIYAPYHENSVGHYYRHKEDVSIIKEMGFDAYRFSISWSRVMPNGRDPNEEGIDFYHRLLDELLDNGIEPFVTLWHFDHPQALEDEYGGLLSSRLAEDYKNYADLCFSRFGDKVKHWITFNEPTTFCIYGYVVGTMPTAPDTSDGSSKRNLLQRTNPTAKWGFTPLIRIKPRPSTSLVGQKRSFAAMSEEAQPINIALHRDAGRDVYTAGHNILLSHARAVNLYRTKYQAFQQGQIGITLSTYWYVPYSDLPKDKEAAQRAQDFELGWFLHPVATGDYPENMRKFVTDGRLPEFTEEESALLKGSFDFIGSNYYSARFAADNPHAKPGDYYSDQQVTLHTHRGGVPIGEPTGIDWLYIYPRGIMDLMVYIKTKYNSPTIYITENGIPDIDDQEISLWKALFDYKRISFYFEHLWYIRTAIWLGVNVKGFILWSLLDNLEWSSGYKYRFGLNYVDFKDGQKNGSSRYPKLSAGWFKFLLEK